MEHEAKKTDPRYKNLRPNKKGERRGGRARGQPNKIPPIVKEAILEAAARLGSDNKGKGGLLGFFERLGLEEPALFGRLLGRVMLYQESVKGGVNETETVAYRTVEEARLGLAERGYSADEIELMLGPNLGPADGEKH